MRSGESSARSMGKVSAEFPPAHSLLRTAAARCAGGRKRALATVVMATKGLDRKASAAGAEGKRMLILDQEKCKPMMPAHDFLKRIMKSCNRDCITMDQNKKIQILEDACLACLNRAKQCPGDAVKIINLPSNLQTDVTHKCATPTPILPPRPAHCCSGPEP